MSRRVRRPLTILWLVLAFAPLILPPTTARAELPARVYEILGTDLIALNTALQEFRRRLPDKDVRDYNITVLVYEEEIAFSFVHKNRPEGVLGHIPEYPSLAVHVSVDGMEVLKSSFQR